jgi:hypothetical protein
MRSTHINTRNAFDTNPIRGYEPRIKHGWNTDDKASAGKWRRIGEAGRPRIIMKFLHYEFDLSANDVVDVTLDRQANGAADHAELEVNVTWMSFPGCYRGEAIASIRDAIREYLEVVENFARSSGQNEV